MVEHPALHCRYPPQAIGIHQFKAVKPTLTLSLSMPVNATIPVTGDFREVTLGLGEADNITALWLTGNYLFAITDTIPAKLVRLNKDDFSQRTSITFANDGNHEAGTDIIYCSPSKTLIQAS